MKASENRARGGKRIGRRFLLWAVVLVAAVAGWYAVALDPPVNGLQPATVQRVVDGDTIVVTLAGEEQRVRMILVDTPESVHPDDTKNLPAGKRASAFTAAALPVGTAVYLQKDVSETDRYDRLLRYVWTEVPTSLEAEAEVRAKMYNARLLLEGYAQVAVFPPDVKYQALFVTLAREAERAGRGLWADSWATTAAAEAAAVEGAASKEAAPKEAAASKEAASKEAVSKEAAPVEEGYVLNTSTKRFHKPDCAAVAQISPQNYAVIDRRAAALEQGYVPCGACKP